MQTESSVKRMRLRSLDRRGDRHASWLELFFDLVFVLAIAQITHHFTAHISVGGAIQFVLLFALIWWAWVGYTFYADRFETDETIYRLLMFAGMLAVAGFAVNAGEGIDRKHADAIAVSYIIVRGILLILYARAAYLVHVARQYSLTMLKGFGIGILFWTISLFVPAPYKYAFWAIGFAVEILTPVIFTNIVSRTPYDQEHIPERFGLFTIIVLGEALIATANGISEVEWAFSTVLIGSFGFAVAVCLWWLNFEFVEDYAFSSDKMSIRFTYLYGHFFMVAGIVIAGVGAEHAILEANQAVLPFETRLIFCGGILIFLFAISAIRLSLGYSPIILGRILGITAITILLFAGAVLSPILFVAILLAFMAFGVWLEFKVGEGAERETGENLQTKVCTHTDAIENVQPQSEVCLECAESGDDWVQLRLCRTCGYVGCCESSKNKHMKRHFETDDHPIMKTFEDFEEWSWCYIDEMFINAD